nr:MAG TPA: hypothetical protein [Bacteriophage sp.]
MRFLRGPGLTSDRHLFTRYIPDMTLRGVSICPEEQKQ